MSRPRRPAAGAWSCPAPDDGKTHGAADPDEHVGPEPEGAALEAQGFG
jgi:catalase (peroxidase I)